MQRHVSAAIKSEEETLEGFRVSAGVGRKKTQAKMEKTSFKQIVRDARNSMRNSDRDVFKSALNGARAAVKKAGGKSGVSSPPRILLVPLKIGGVSLLLLPIFAD
ncbi:hypothetical protein PV326_009166 [Microctonus aethiopoides]|nr:hypothetical protein PV326_009166 [Microctonus aethiopoides]